MYTPKSVMHDTLELDIVPYKEKFDEFRTWRIEEEKDFTLDWRTLYMDEFENDADTALDVVMLDTPLTLISFFSTQMIDIPLCFQKSRSLYWESAEDPEARFLNMLMRHGRRRYVSKLYAVAMQAIMRTRLRTISSDSHVADWRFFYLTFANFQPLSSNTPLAKGRVFLDSSVLDCFQQNHELAVYETGEGNWLRDFLFHELEDYTPVFSFYVKKVDKMKRKHSRGKSGKYSISWKYVPKYKRLWVVLRWLVKDIRFQKAQTLSKRLATSLELLLFSKENHLVYQLRQFVHKFVFQAHRKTLLKTLRSTT